jgi:hypothetical protein
MTRKASLNFWRTSWDALTRGSSTPPIAGNGFGIFDETDPNLSMLLHGFGPASWIWWLPMKRLTLSIVAGMS